jgi:hypothetical protein
LREVVILARRPVVLVMGKDRVGDDAQMFQGGQQTEEIQDTVYEANGRIPSGCLNAGVKRVMVMTASLASGAAATSQSA